ncbi:MAG: cupin domain-containing protein [Bacteroidota bacterium]
MIKKVFKEIERFEPGKPVQVPIANGERTKIVMLCLSPGASEPPHSHPGYELSLMPLKGRGKLPLGLKQEILLQPGEIYLVDGGMSFNPKNPFEEDFEMLVHLVKK